ncbi:MAG: peptidylprolyl isomerase [Candidatus Brocadiales bacterium]|nr:peptidylprolyl isomerase [Candidatus Brocadiales bacterium]
MSAAIENYISKDIDDKKQEEYFMKNISNFNGETVTASHILVDTKGMKSQEELDKARAKIESVKKEIDEGADFAECAKKYSDCPTGKTGGELGASPRHGAMVEAFAKAAFDTEVGKVSEPVKTEFGYHLIKVTAHTPAKDVSFSEVKDKVREVLIGTEMNNLVNDLKEKAKIEITLQ